ncbi:HEAT repeat domain-containing protein [Telmatocola sphagniphila]|uniref:HEAT repeat domain-containing protein n=1 Tax=Telmatocola sphagniphila TaxID=1123043 RepID=A0A8E6ET99_9BACT|nr:HEAT repeat domain-containing protein [Telmatocola sphagniphila]QVL32179.1 HEAT repeat domain-containing protein [Telmatocola sphagniphila]
MYPRTFSLLLILFGATLLTAQNPASQSPGDSSAPAKTQTPPAKSGNDSDSMKKEFNPPSTNYPKDLNGRGPEFFAREARESNDPSIREAAMRTLVVFGPPARKFCGSAIIHGLTQDKDLSVRMAALYALQNLGLDEDKDIETAIKTVCEMLLSPQMYTRYEATLAIASVGSKAKKEALDKLIKLSDKTMPSWQLRRAAVAAIGRVGYDDGKGFPDAMALHSLILACNDSSYVVRKEAIQSLIILAKTTVPAVDSATVVRTLINRVKEEKDAGTATWARAAIVWYEGPKLKADNPHLVALIKQLKDSNPIQRYEAYFGLGTAGRYIGMKVKDLMEAVEQEKEDSNVGMGVWALGNLGAAGEPALPLLNRIASTHKNEDVKRAANDAIKYINALKGTSPTTPEKKDPKKN